MGFRVVERERWPHLMGGDFLLQPAEYARVIIEQARTRPQHRDVAFHTCGLLVHIEELDFANKTEKLRSLMNGNVYGVGKGTPDGIQDFESPGSPISTATGVDRLRNRNLISALENVQIVMEVFYSPAFETALGTFIGLLKNSAQPMMLVTAAYLKHSVELQLTTFFRVVRSKKHNEPPLVSLATPKERGPTGVSREDPACRGMSFRPSSVRLRLPTATTSKRRTPSGGRRGIRFPSHYG